ncbi:MAG TPA: hypothetical protein DCQ20_03790 [Nitrospira sp.]|nr:hypothetical protein [Nitrospira sp.]
MIDNDWINDLIAKSKAATHKEAREHQNPLEAILISKLIESSVTLHQLRGDIPLGRLLAATFDLVVSADYYSSVGHKSWFFCPGPAPRLYFHFTNCCPRHVLSNIFHFHASSKPESGSIGKSTSRLLRSFINTLLVKRGRVERVLKGTEPVDVVVLNETTKHVLFGEIKASPLLTLPLSMDAEAMGEEHEASLTMTEIYGRPMRLFVPEKQGETWGEKLFAFGSRASADDKHWGYRSMIAILDDQTFLPAYYAFWDASLAAYHPKHTASVYWLTNGCGAPSPRPEWWPKSKGGDGGGFESISDSKTSVGMDRTDDIKKGIYQVLKLGSEGKPVSSEWCFKVGIVSNIHAARHFEEYLKSLRNLVWTHDASGQATKAGDLDPDHPLYNLFDGVLALTECHFRDAWLKQVFDLDAPSA